MRTSGIGGKADVGNSRFVRPAADSYWRATSSNESWCRADNASRCNGRSGMSVGTGFKSGASSTITCAFVPLNPNELIPATTTPLNRGHGVTAVGTVIGNPAQSIRGLPDLKCRCGGISRR